MKRIHVVAGILRDAHDRVLLAQRGAGKHLAGLWEFPGGKVERDEAPLAALRRELLEEIGVDVDAAEPLISVPWTYPEKRVDLDVYDVTAWRGDPIGREGQALQWTAIGSLHDAEMPAADRPVITALRLPRVMSVTPPPGDDLDAWATEVEAAIPGGARLVQLRAPGRATAALRAVAVRLGAVAASHGVELLVNGAPDVANELGLGLHLGARAARAETARPIDRQRWFGVSAHDELELAQARALDADYVVIGPVDATATHPGVAPMGWTRFSELARVAPLPCFAIGGLSPGDLPTARAHGGFGVAGIRGFWRVRG